MENDLGSWFGISVDAPITEKVQSKFYVSPRLLDNSTDFNQLILHGLLGYKLNKNLSIWQGYAWSTTYIPNFRREQRPYNDIVYENSFKKLKYENRFRLEERFLQDIEGITLRGRNRIKLTYPLGKSDKWKLVFFDELFINFNSHFGGPQAGIDQNRIFIGLNRRINKYLQAEGGYQLQHQHREGKNNDNLNHFVLVNLNFILPRLKKM